MATGLEWRNERRKLVQAGLAEPTSHGATGYDQGHRCDVCREGNRLRHKRKRRRRAQRTPFDLIPHGPKGYRDYECRCPACTEGHRLERAEEREKARAAKAA
jgi:hypothetical protein